MKWCPNCGKELTKDGFCGNCGSISVMPGIKPDVTDTNQTKELKDKKADTNKKNSKPGLEFGCSIAGFLLSLVSLISLRFLKPCLLNGKCGFAGFLGDIEIVLFRSICLLFIILSTVFSVLGISKKNIKMGLIFSTIGIIICIVSLLLCFNIIPTKIILF